MSQVRDINQSFWRCSELSWVELRSTWASTCAYKLHQHAQLSLGAIIEGGTCCVIDGIVCQLQVGDIVVINAGAPHSCNPVGSRARSYHMLYLDVEWCQAALGYGLQPLLSTQPVIQDAALFQQYLNIVCAIQRNNISDITAAITRFVRDLPGIQPAIAPPLRSSSQVLQQRILACPESPPTLDTLAQEISLCKETLIRTFKQDTGLTPGSFLNITRIEYAKSLLREGRNIIDAGNDSGFADQSHFHKTFVRYTAATPRQYALSKSIMDNN
ncbi:AraC family transcriptional regulator [Klebsiella sp. BIGb0407]|uniref:AraC family transcriptional regulator n=1 Tax=Klebsiella sp. BIGb0407 TaxID=2940603 RepID=UPI002169085A|nr:AraC family transcriptional regulator [Klebsiella sp. BIGb0407]MCS3434377.1 AraC-like DNA-binding protein [Klebsiella sp. BIGb0407]